jgi:hypothetical protein
LSTTGALLFALALQAAGGSAAAEHLRAGANHFRDGRYGDSLVEFRVAERLGAPDAARYAGAALVKLERFEDALEAFGADDEPGPDALVDYYRAVACYGAKLYGCADRLLAGAGARAGPRIAAQSAKLRGTIAAELAREPSPSAVEWHLARCDQRRAQGRTGLAAAYCREASALAMRRGDADRRARADGALAEMGRGGRR